MDDRTKYLLALGAFRASVRNMAEMGNLLRVASEAHDGDDSAAIAIHAECIEDLRSICVTAPGIRQMLAATLGVE